MMVMTLRNFIRPRTGFWSRQEGAVLAEALVAVPFVTLVAAGILEFGNIFWERMQIDAGLRDAGRYLSRCRPASGTYVPTCDELTAKRIAFFGTQALDATTPRVPGWGPDPAAITISPVVAADCKPTNPLVDPDCTFTVATSHLYRTSPLFGWLGIDAITINSSHQEWYIGW